MHRTRSKFLLPIGITYLFSSALVFAQGDDFPTDNTFGLTGDAVFLTRGKGKTRTLAIDTSIPVITPKSNIVLESDGLNEDFSYEPGYRVEGTFIVNNTTSFEATFLQIFEWDTSEEVDTNGTLQFPFERAGYANDFTSAQKARAHYETNFLTAEFNYWEAITPRNNNYFSFSAIFGTRYVHIGEEFKLTYTKSTNASDYKVSTENDLIGVQVGGDLQWNPTRKLSWDLFVKIGGYVNLDEQKTLLRDNNNTTVIQSFHVNRTRGTFIADGGLGALYRIKPWLNFHAGYEVFYLAGVALAPSQLSTKKHTTTSGEIIDNDNICIHGFWVGLTLSF